MSRRPIKLTDCTYTYFLEQMSRRCWKYISALDVWPTPCAFVLTLRRTDTSLYSILTLRRATNMQGKDVCEDLTLQLFICLYYVLDFFIWLFSTYRVNDKRHVCIYTYSLKQMSRRCWKFICLLRCVAHTRCIILTLRRTETKEDAPRTRHGHYSEGGCF